MESRQSPSARLLAGLAVMLSAVAIYSGYTIVQMRSLRGLQTGIIDRNRKDSLLLLRIQNNLDAIGTAMRDMLDTSEPYPLTAWRNQFQRLRTDLDDAFERERKLAPASRTPDQTRYLAASLAQFWDAVDRNFELAARDEAEARAQIRISLQARQAALTSAVARLLVQNNEGEEQAAARIQQIYSGVERNVYIFLAAILLVAAATSAYLLAYNRRMFDQVSALSERRSELAQQLISMQENTFRSISRELHDDFGQILTGVGAMLQRLYRRAAPADEKLRGELREVHEIVQSALDKVRSLSQALHPVMLEETGLESAMNTYLPAFEKRTGIEIDYRQAGQGTVGREQSIHIYRVMQEALNNVARHSKSSRAHVRLDLLPASVILEVEDEGVGLEQGGGKGMGLVSMRERAEMMKGAIQFSKGPLGGTLVRLEVPRMEEDAHAGV